MNIDFFLNKYGSAIILFFIIIFAFVPVPIFFMSIFTWIILFIMIYQLTSRWDVSLLLATAFLILLLIFKHLGNNTSSLGQPLFVEGFEDKTNDDNVPEVEPKEVSNEPKEVSNEAKEVSVEPREVSNEQQQLKTETAMSKLTDESVGNLVSMETDNIFGGDSLENVQEDDLLNKIADEKTEDDSEDESDSEDEDDEEVFAKGNKRRKSVGRTKKSKKTAYKAQKDLYNLVNTTKLLKSTLESMTPALSNGKKIMQKMESLGIMDSMGKM
jgi:energy-coupling factor transporter transmembrane protein EcfT